MFSQLLHVACIIDGLNLIHSENEHSHIMTQSMFWGGGCYDVNLCVDVHMFKQHAQESVGKTEKDVSQTWQEAVAKPRSNAALAQIQ